MFCLFCCCGCLLGLIDDFVWVCSGVICLLWFGLGSCECAGCLAGLCLSRCGWLRCGLPVGLLVWACVLVVLLCLLIAPGYDALVLVCCWVCLLFGFGVCLLLRLSLALLLSLCFGLRLACCLLWF